MKETLAQMFPCEFYEISKNTFFYRTPLVAASWQKIGIPMGSDPAPFMANLFIYYENRWVR